MVASCLRIWNILAMKSFLIAVVLVGLVAAFAPEAQAGKVHGSVHVGGYAGHHHHHHCYAPAPVAAYYAPPVAYVPPVAYYPYPAYAPAYYAPPPVAPYYGPAFYYGRPTFSVGLHW